MSLDGLPPGMSIDLSYRNKPVDMTEAYPLYTKFSPDVQEFLHVLTDINAKVQTIAFHADGTFETVAKGDDVSFRATMTVTVDTDKIKAEMADTSQEMTEANQSKMSTATKVATLIASGIAIATIYKYSDQLVGLSTDDLKSQMQNVIINIKKPFEAVSEFARDKILGSEERLLCEFKVRPDLGEGVGEKVCDLKDVKVTWTDAYNDALTHIGNTKIVQGVRNAFNSFLSRLNPQTTAKATPYQPTNPLTPGIQGKKLALLTSEKPAIGLLTDASKHSTSMVPYKGSTAVGMFTGLASKAPAVKPLQLKIFQTLHYILQTHP